MLEKLEALGKSILAKLGYIGANLHEYITVALQFTTNLENILKEIQKKTGNPIVKFALKELVPSADQAMLAKIEALIPVILPYITQSQAVLSAATPEDMLAQLLQEIATAAPGEQNSTLFNLASELVKDLAGNTMLRSEINYLVQKYFTASKQGQTA